MGSPLAPVFANSKPKFCLKHVQDIRAAFDKEQDSLNFLNFESILTSNLR